MENSKVVSKGGNQYEVTIGDETRIVDMDGVFAVSDQDYEKLEKAGLDGDDFFAPKHSDGDKFFELALDEMLNYSGFDAEEYIRQNK